MGTGEGDYEESWLVRGESAAGWERFLAELLDMALASTSGPDPQPSQEEVESVFRAVTASYDGQ